ncbi:MAG: zinc-dependent peptidase, partial [Owenweeksia sp.]
FVHLIDKMDGATDGVPDVLMRHPQTIPWLKMMKGEIRQIMEKDSDIRPYGATNQAEFYSVASEYFFKRPRLFKKKHPELYEALTVIFKQNPADPQKTRDTEPESSGN